MVVRNWAPPKSVGVWGFFAVQKITHGCLADVGWDLGTCLASHTRLSVGFLARVGAGKVDTRPARALGVCDRYHDLGYADLG